MIEEHISLAFALTSSPGAYAVLFGAGVSVASGVPSAWGVQEALIQRLAAAEGEHPEDAFAWYLGRYGQPATYDGVLAALTGSQTERQALLREFFEPGETDREEGRKVPTPAHVALARLVAAGLVRVILTTNFDHLTETALRSAGIEPTVVATPADIDGLKPLHSIACLVVHLHGDYLNPTGMLNTAEELGAYPPNLDRRLDRIFEDYGLVIAGWSATWDQALRAAVSRCPSRRYTTYWVDPFPLSEAADTLRVARDARLVPRTADDFFGRVADACDAIVTEAHRLPASVAVAVASAKRSLSGGRTAIDLHDLVREQVEQVRNLEPVSPGSFDLVDDAELLRRVDILDAGIEMLLALVATAAYWGDGRTDRWWFDDIERFAEPPAGASGIVALIELTRAPATYLLYAAGVAAAAAARWDLVVKLLTEPTTPDEDRVSRRPVAYVLSPGRALPMDPRASRRLHMVLRPLFIGYLALGEVVYVDAWERFEYLRLVSSRDDARTNKRGWSDGGVPHLRAAGNSMDGHPPVVSNWLRGQFNRDGVDHPLLTGGLFGGDLDRARSAQEDYDTQFAGAAKQAAWSTVQGGAGQLPSGRWYPDETPMYTPRIR